MIQDSLAQPRGITLVGKQAEGDGRYESAYRRLPANATIFSAGRYFSFGQNSAKPSTLTGMRYSDFPAVT